MESELYRAIEGNDTDSALGLIAAGADLNVVLAKTDGDTMSNLSRAIFRGYTEVAFI